METMQDRGSGGEDMEGDRLWTLPEAAHFLVKSRRWLFRAMKTPETESGSIPYVRLGGTPRFVPDDLKGWVAMGCPPVATYREWVDAERSRKRR